MIDLLLFYLLFYLSFYPFNSIFRRLSYFLKFFVSFRNLYCCIETDYFPDQLGFLGVILAIPLLASIRVFWLSAVPIYLASHAFRPEGAEDSVSSQ